GFYYLSSPGEDGTSAIQFFESATGQVKTLGRTTGQAGFWSLAVSPNRRSILWVQLDSAGSDLMLVENFR
ncbi:MAG: hypothetical protein GY953_50605, partial [bacterium]|nr:hypothetical protein [bacterium]